MKKFTNVKITCGGLPLTQKKTTVIHLNMYLMYAFVLCQFDKLENIIRVCHVT